MNSYFSFSDRPISKFPIATFYVKITQPFQTRRRASISEETTRARALSFVPSEMHTTAGARSALWACAPARAQLCGRARARVRNLINLILRPVHQ